MRGGGDVSMTIVLDDDASGTRETSPMAEREALPTGFHDAAKAEWRSANAFRCLTFFLLACSLGIAIYTATYLHNPSWKVLIAHLAIHVPLILGAYRASSEASDHRGNARKERGWQNRLGTIWPYTSDLPAFDRDAVRTEFGKQLFTEPAEVGVSDTLADSTDRLIKQAREIASAFKDAGI